MNPDKMLADAFEAIGKIVGKIQVTDKPKSPDTAGIPIGHLISDDEMADPRKLFVSDPTVPRIQFTHAARLPFLDIFDGTYASPIQTAFPPANTVHVKHFRLRRPDPNRPTVIMINGLNLDTNFYFDWWCWRFAAWGLDSALLMMPFSQKRVPRGSFSGQYAFTPDTAWTLLTIKHCFVDIQRFVNWLKRRGPGPVGTFGVSFGALVSGIFVCQSPAADFTIIGMPPVDCVEIFHHWDFTDELKAREARGEATLLTDPRVPPIMNMAAMQPQIDRDKIFLAEGIYDHLVDPESIERAVASWGGLKWLRRYPTGHLNTFVFNHRFIQDVHRFVHEEIL